MSVNSPGALATVGSAHVPARHTPFLSLTSFPHTRRSRTRPCALLFVSEPKQHCVEGPRHIREVEVLIVEKVGVIDTGD